MHHNLEQSFVQVSTLYVWNIISKKSNNYSSYITILLPFYQIKQTKQLICSYLLAYIINIYKK